MTDGETANRGANIVYCWELGGGYGHVARMDAISARAEFNGDHFTFALKDQAKHTSIKRACKANLCQAPLFVDADSHRQSPNFSDLLLRSGWQDPAHALQLVREWLRIFTEAQADLVIADHAPSAAIAATLAGFPLLNAGNGFEIPLPANPMPPLRFWQKSNARQLASLDAALNRTIAEIARRTGNQARSDLTISDLFRPDNSLLITHPALDHYGQRPPTWRYLPIETPIATAATLAIPAVTQRPPIFCYLRGDDPKLLELFLLLGNIFEVYAVLTGANAVFRDKVRAMGIHLAADLVNINAVLPRVAAVICHGGIGLVSQALNARKPIIVMPQHLEQSMLAHRLAMRRLVKLASVAQPAAVASKVQQAIDSFDIGVLDATLQQSAGDPAIWTGTIKELTGSAAQARTAQR
ncbi:MAG: hypothetical protein H6978_04475 [Gammaproteobacteria bacterium]|nr:hypothetical protein [Gammaproteobacteria bacterium]